MASSCTRVDASIPLLCPARAWYLQQAAVSSHRADAVQSCSPLAERRRISSIPTRESVRGPLEGIRWRLHGSTLRRLHTKEIKGLVLWASYRRTPTTCPHRFFCTVYQRIQGRLATPAKIAAARPLLPPATTYRPIDGGNHAQFGSYGTQMGDHSATITADEQWRLVVQATADFLAQVAAQP